MHLCKCYGYLITTLHICKNMRVHVAKCPPSVLSQFLINYMSLVISVFFFCCCFFFCFFFFFFSDSLPPPPPNPPPPAHAPPTSFNHDYGLRGLFHICCIILYYRLFSGRKIRQIFQFQYVVCYKFTQSAKN